MKLFVFLLSVFSLIYAEQPRFRYRGPPSQHKPYVHPQIMKKWQQNPPPFSKQQHIPKLQHYPKEPNFFQQHNFPKQPNFPQKNFQSSLMNPRPPVNLQRPSIPVHMPNHHKIQMGAASVTRPVVAVPVRHFWKNAQKTTFRTPIVSKNENSYVTSTPVFPKKTFQSSPTVSAQEYDLQIQSNNIPTSIKPIKQIGEKGPIHTIPAPNLSPADKPLMIEEVKPQQKFFGIEDLQIQHQPEAATIVQIQKAHQYQVTESPDIKQPFNNYEVSYQPQHDVYQLVNVYQHPVSVVSNKDHLQPFTSQNYVEQVTAIDKNSNEDPRGKDLPGEQEVSESIVRSQYVQNYFNNQEKGDLKEEVDAKPSEKDKNKTLNESYYISLPNKETADSLANLQAAGKLNSNLMQRGKNEDLPMSIYVPEEEESRDRNYEDYGEDLITEEMHHGEDFGSRLKPK